jgi:hypothetical protein
VYFLRLMADGRKLRSKVRYSQADPVLAEPESEPALITSDYPAWMAHPYVETGEAGGEDVPFRQGEIEFPGPDQIFS